VSTRQADPLRSASAFLSGRLGTVSVAVYDLATHQTWTVGAGRPQDEASVIKVDILEALLDQHPAGLTPAQAALAQRMIEDSDNDAATALWDAVGGTDGIRAFDAKAGLTGTTPSACVVCADFPWPGWGLTTTTPLDQLTLLRELLSPDSVLSAVQRKAALRLMEDVTPDQRWGVSGGVPSQVKIALKNGWLPLNAADTDWQINSIGWVSGLGRDYLIAVLSTGNPSEAYGVDTISELSAIIWRQLA
jgi:beta-lactamase class A